MKTALLTVVAGALMAAQVEHGAMYHFPRWSPDGKSILVAGMIDGDSELYLLPVDGGAPRQLTDNSADDEPGLWIDGGKRILFKSDRRGHLEPFVMNADGTDQKPTDIEPPVSTSPDGRTRLIESEVDGRGVLIAVGADGTRRQVTTGPNAEQGSYSPDGRSIVFEQRLADDPDNIPLSNIVVAKADGTTPRIVASGTDPSWSPDGRLILFKSFDRDTRQLWISTVQPDGKGMRRLEKGVHPHWSPDGRRIAFMQDRPGGRADIVIMDRDGGHPRCLTCPSRSKTAIQPARPGSSFHALIDR
jgi:Tol biopolymer transport system component